MAGTGNHLDSLRPSRLKGDRLLIALALSVLAHALLFGAYELRDDLHLPPKLRWLAMVKPVPLPVQRDEQPLEFVTVQTPSTPPPQQAKYVSNKNSVAANPDSKRNTDTPQINGRQSDVPQPEDIRQQLSKSNTGDDQHQANSVQQASPYPKPSEDSGDLTLGKPDDAQQEHRPRTLKDAYAQMAKRMPSIAMQQDGGAKLHARAAFNVKITGFGDYDQRFADAVDQNWNNLLYSQRFALDRTGRVVLLFRLNYDGSISQMRMAENTVGPLLGYVCEKAVLDGAPYEPWTEDMRLKLGDSCDVQYTFDYFEE